MLRIMCDTSNSTKLLTTDYKHFTNTLQWHFSKKLDCKHFQSYGVSTSKTALKGTIAWISGGNNICTYSIHEFSVYFIQLCMSGHTCTCIHKSAMHIIYDNFLKRHGILNTIPLRHLAEQNTSFPQVSAWCKCLLSAMFNRKKKANMIMHPPLLQRRHISLKQSLHIQ